GALLTFSLNAEDLPLPEAEKERARKARRREDARAAGATPEALARARRGLPPEPVAETPAAPAAPKAE
ncbi:MAG TPA: cytochrome c family protein, partial [Acidobacteria bacterium]|nr:cytochrome c family protein [Acidobacteriota bacterium]